MVNLPNQVAVYNTIVMQLWMVASRGMFRSRCLKSCTSNCTVIGDHLGCFNVGGVRLLAPMRAAFSCELSMFHSNPCSMCHD